MTFYSSLFCFMLVSSTLLWGLLLELALGRGVWECFIDLVIQYAEELYGAELDKMRNETVDVDVAAGNPASQAVDDTQGSAAVQADDPSMDIEAEIAAEVKDMRKPTTDPLFTNVKVDVQCGMFTFFAALRRAHGALLFFFMLDYLYSTNAPKFSSSKRGIQSNQSPLFATSVTISSQIRPRDVAGMLNVSHP